MFFLKPTKRKLVISLIPFYFLIPIFLLVISDKIALDISFINNALLGGTLISYVFFVAFGEPFESILKKFGFWHDGSSLFIAFSGPDIEPIGLFLIALFYSLVIYLFLSTLQKYKFLKS